MTIILSGTVNFTSLCLFLQVFSWLYEIISLLVGSEWNNIDRRYNSYLRLTKISLIIYRNTMSLFLWLSRWSISLYLSRSDPQSRSFFHSLTLFHPTGGGPAVRTSIRKSRHLSGVVCLHVRRRPVAKGDGSGGKRISFAGGDGGVEAPASEFASLI